MARISTRQLAHLCRRVGQSLNAGLTARDVFQRESQSGVGPYRSRLSFVSTRLAGGETLTDSVKATGDYFPPFFRAMVNVGESTGQLDCVLLRMAEYYQRVIQLRRTFLTGILYPAIQLIAAIVIVGLLILIMGALSPELDILGIGATGTKAFAVYVLMVLAAAAVIAVPIILIQRRGFGSGLLLQIVLALPLLGKWLHALALSRLTWSLSMADGAGMDIRLAVRLALESTQNAYYISHIDTIDQVIRGGGEVHEAFRKTGAFSPEFLMALENGEVSGQLAESMEHLSKEYDARAKSASNVLIQLAAFGVWGIVAVFIIYLIFRLAFLLYFNPLYENL